MKYTKPEVESIELNLVDIIRTSGDEENPENGEYVPGKNETEFVPRTNFWG